MGGSITSSSGFSLVELLVSLGFSIVLLTAAVAALMAHFRYTATLEAQNRLQENWSRVNLLLETEIAEADTVAAGGPNCDGAAASMTLNLRNADNTAGPGAQITYGVNAADELVRCGPGVAADGTLLFGGGTVPAVLAPNAVLAVDTTNNRRPIYTLTLTDPASGVSYANQVSAARARVRVIDQ